MGDCSGYVVNRKELDNKRCVHRGVISAFFYRILTNQLNKMATKAKTTGNKRKTIKELQWIIDCQEKSITYHKFAVIGLAIVLVSMYCYLSF